MVPKNDAVFAFLTDVRDAKKARARLFERAGESPELVLTYLDGLPPGTVEGDEVLLKLRSIALAAQEKKGA
ncbi:MAG: hypothetical protein RBU21_21955 [FCB group bacterium]|jgi:hypothetical protein|nr:hypothetical protein [FCB group bacterium]